MSRHDPIDTTADLQHDETPVRGAYQDVPPMHFALNRDGTIVSINGQGAEQLGYAVEELLGRPVDVVLHPDDRRAVRDHLAVAIRNPGRLFEGEFRKVRKDGGVLWVHDQVRTSTGNGSGPSILLVSYNITSPRRAQQELLEYQARLRTLTIELALAEERERRRLGVGLHDRIGQTLAVAGLKLGGLVAAASDAPARQALQEVWGLIDEAIREIRSMTFELTSPVLYELGLEAALKSLGERTRADHHLPWEFRVEGPPRRLPRDTEVVVFRTARELLHNVVKHAQATRFVITVRYGSEDVAVVVADNGKGFEPARSANSFGPNGGFGFFSIREQLRQFGGRLLIDTAPGRGTRAVATVPSRPAGSDRTPAGQALTSERS